MSPNKKGAPCANRKPPQPTDRHNKSRDFNSMTGGVPQANAALPLRDGVALRVKIEAGKSGPVVDIRMMRRATMAPALFPTGEGFALDVEHLPALVQALQAISPQPETGGRQ